MSRWSDEFEKHAIHETLRHSIEWLAKNAENSNAEIEAERLRLSKIISQLAEVINGLDPNFHPKKLLDQIHAHLRQPNFYNQLQSYSTSPQLGLLQTANNHIDQVSQHIYQLSAMSRPIESQKVIKLAEDAFASFAVNIETKANEIEGKNQESEEVVSQLGVKVVELEQRLASLGTASDEKLSEWQADFTEKQTSRAEEYSDSQIERDTKFEEFLAEWRKASEAQTAEITKSHKSELATTLDHFKETGEAVLKDVDEKHKSVLEIHKLVGRDSVAGGYQKSAGEEQGAANLWRVISMISLGLAVVWLGIKYLMGFEQYADGGMNWAEIVTASSLTAVFLLASGYASRQSKMHRDNEKQMRWFALETKALDPFIASLDRKDQNIIKSELIRRMFGQQQVQANGSATRSDEGTVKSLLEDVSSTVTNAVGKALNKS